MHDTDKDNNIINTLTARNMDWAERFDTNLWAFPAGVTRNSMPGNPSEGFEWTSKYKSVGSAITAGKNDNGKGGFLSGNDNINEEAEFISTNDGINEEGLVINGLYLAESNYTIKSASITNKMHMTIWGQYMLDNYTNVEEAIKGWVGKKVEIVTSIIPAGGKDGNLHMSLSDSQGNSAIFEYYKEKLHISTNIKIASSDLPDDDYFTVNYFEDCNIMTNSPNYHQQVKLNYYWQWQWQWQWDEGEDFEKEANKEMRTHTLPGTHTAPDRFARSSFYLKYTKKESTTKH